METIFKGLADATRLRVLNLLTEGELCGCDIQRLLGVSQANVSRHLAYLNHAGLVEDRREGYRVFYRLAEAADPTLQDLFQFLAAAFRRDKTLRNDLQRLRSAMKAGTCALPLARLPGKAQAALGTAAGRRLRLRRQAHRPVRQSGLPKAHKKKGRAQKTPDSRPKGGQDSHDEVTLSCGSPHIAMSALTPRCKKMTTAPY